MKVMNPIDSRDVNYSLDTEGDLERLNEICKSIES
jgi:hypothetical protein